MQPAALMQRLRQLQEREKTQKMEVDVGLAARRAVRNWGVVLQKVFELIDLVAAQEKVGDWQESGSQFGSNAACSYEVHKSGRSSRPENISKEQQFKAEIYKELIKHGQSMGIRKCKMDPVVDYKVCEHKAIDLLGAGNQSQREVWCNKCHHRWLVDPVAMTQLKEKKEKIIVGDRVFTRSQVGSFAKLPTKLPVEMLRRPASVEAPRTPKNQGTFQRERQLVRSPASLLGTPSEREGSAAIRSHCKCGKEATRLRVKKEGPTQGRHFFKCAARVCDHFEWDATEVMEIKEAMTENAMKEKFQEEMRQQVNVTMIEAEQRHQFALQQQHQAYQTQVEHMHNQLLWMTAVAGEDRLGQVMANPQLQEQMAQQANLLKKKLEDEQAAAASNGSF